MYRIFWRGSTIVRVEKDVLVGDIDISATTAKKQFVTQHFSTSFFHEPDVPPTREVQHISGNFSDSNQKYLYKIQLTLMLRCKSWNCI